MKSIFKYGIIIILIYFGVNWVADNPKSMHEFRKIMNGWVATGAGKASEVFDGIKTNASQSLDK